MKLNHGCPTTLTTLSSLFSIEAKKLDETKDCNQPKIERVEALKKEISGVEFVSLTTWMLNQKLSMLSDQLMSPRAVDDFFLETKKSPFQHLLAS